MCRIRYNSLHTRAIVSVFVLYFLYFVFYFLKRWLLYKYAIIFYMLYIIFFGSVKYRFSNKNVIILQVEVILLQHTFSWSDAPLGIFPAGDIPAISLDVAELADCESAAVAPVVLPVITGLGIGTVGAATGLGTTGGATGVAKDRKLWDLKEGVHLKIKFL